MERIEGREKIDFNLYLITDRHIAGVRPIMAVVEEALKGGIKAVQLREKGLSARELFELAQGISCLTRQYGAQLFINDRIDIALAVGADGVHLGQKGFSAKDARRIFPDAVIGVSTHSLSEAKKAEGDGADFITFGPIFYTKSKADYGKPLGVEAIKKMRKKINIPVFAIGGINKNNIKDIMAAGADGVAVISAIVGARKPEKAAKKILREMA